VIERYDENPITDKGKRIIKFLRKESKNMSKQTLNYPDGLSYKGLTDSLVKYAKTKLDNSSDDVEKQFSWNNFPEDAEPDDIVKYTPRKKGNYIYTVSIIFKSKSSNNLLTTEH
jgi:hypothetical protein